VPDTDPEFMQAGGRSPAQASGRFSNYRNRSNVASRLWSILTIGLLAGAFGGVEADDRTGWIDHGGDRGGSRYSALGLINRDNVVELERAWEFRTGDGAGPLDDVGHAGLQATPILLPEDVGGSLIFCTPFDVVIALDPVNGKVRWRFDPKVKRDMPARQFKCRGVAQWRDDEADPESACAGRVFLATHDQRLYALDSRTGESCVGFGDLGRVRLAPLVKAATPAIESATVQTFMPPAIIGTTLVVGSAVGNKSGRADAPSGEVRAFDVRTGELRWSFDPLRRANGNPGAAESDIQALAATGGANVWSLMSVDEQRDLVFLPTSSASPDYFGGTRPGDNRYANSTIALRGSTGEPVWQFQAVHHDVWGRDAASQPVLADIRQGDTTVPAVVQLTTHGFVFVFHRDSGVPLFRIEERKVPTDGVPGDVLSAVQPFPSAPPPLADTRLGPDDAWGFTFYDKGRCRQILERYRTGDAFTPPSVEGTVIMPGGVSGWGSGAFDAARNLFITNAQNVPMFLRLVPRDDIDPGDRNGPLVIDGTPYAVESGTAQIASPLGLPCTRPPWHKLVAIDMATGKIAWSVPLGTLERTAGLPLELGAPGVGGPIVTAGGVVFIAATADEKFRAFDVETGKKLWEIGLPTSGMATPMTYAAGGRQFVVIAAGGHPEFYSDKVGDYLVAFALPE